METCLPGLRTEGRGSVKPYYEKDDITVYQADCLVAMRELADNSIDTILTDPPYSLNFMNKKWDNGDIAFNTEVWTECLRVAKPGATLMAFGGSRTYHRLACAIEDAGWEIRDCVSYFNDGTQQERAFMASLSEEQLAAYLELHYPNVSISWVYGQGMALGLNIGKALDKEAGAEREVVGDAVRVDGRIPANEKSHELNGLYELGIKDAANRKITVPATPLAKTFDGWNSRLKPAAEFIVCAMKPMGQSYAANAKEFGVAGLWVDGARIGVKENDPNHGAPSKTQNSKAKNCYGDGLNGRPHENLNLDGRWPANTIRDNSEEVEKEFAKAGVRTSGGQQLRRKEVHDRHIYGDFAAYEKENFHPGDTGTASRFFQSCPPDTEPARFIYTPKASKKDRGKGNTHSTVKPLSLMRYLARLTKTPYGGVILDPFAGSGTTGLAARFEGRQAILIEKEIEYCEIIVNRLEGKEDVSPAQAGCPAPEKVHVQMNLFEPEQLPLIGEVNNEPE